MRPSGDVVAQIVQRNLGVYRADAGRLKEDVSQEAQIAEDYRGRLVYELLQNADDAMEDQASHDDRVAFLVTDDALWMANTGRPLTGEDVVGLCGLGASSKTDSQGVRRASIGHKGLGFKSVLEITDRPAAYSTTYRFELGEPHARPHIEALWQELGRPAPSRVPAMRFPTPLGHDAPAWRGYREEGYQTGFCFPFRASVDLDKRRALADQLLHLPLTTVLFLKHLEQIEVRVEQQGRSLDERWTVTRQRRIDEAWRDCAGMSDSGLYRITVSTSDDALTFLVSHDADVPIGEHRVGLSGPAWEGVDLTEVSVAVIDPATTGQLDPPARRFHVFLPTEQPSPYPLLVNGAFATDLSRQRVKVTDEAGDYNAHLVRAAGRVFREQLVPVLSDHGPDAVLATLERSTATGDDTTELLHDAMAEALGDVPLLPAETGGLLTLREVIVPPAQLEEHGAQYREVLPPDARWEERAFPAAAFCTGFLGRVAADHGAGMLSGAEAVAALGLLADPHRSRLLPHESFGFELDPVLDLCVQLWQKAEPSERAAVEQAATDHPVFPVHRHDDGIVRRVAVREHTAFYPARAAKHDLPLSGLQFLCHDVCWGALLPKERTDMLGDRMLAWAGLFDIREFDFEEVMRAAVIPALRLEVDGQQQALRDRLEDLDSLAAICQLAGKRPKPDRPLRYQRLGSDRALFNLARLPVPCRTVDGEERWEPAFKVYFGADWIGEDSVEQIMDAIPPEDQARGHIERIVYLAPPEAFLGRLDLPADGEARRHAPPDQDADDEVDLDEDADTPLETDERERWIAFLSWLGVNHALRPVHFHDVEDHGSGWVSTKDLSQPQGWAFARLGATWDTFRAQLQQAVQDHADPVEVDPYLYQAHDLEFIVPVLDAAARPGGDSVGAALLAHLTHHWGFYRDFTEAELALVGAGKWPSHRAKPARAMVEELAPAGDNLWVHRLRSRSFCPTSHGPRQPDQTWLASSEATRRFGARGRSAGDFLPLLQLEGVDPQRLQAVAQHLGIRTELSPATFGIHDARLLTDRLRALYGNQSGAATVSAPELRAVVRPVYRELFELLSGQASRTGASPPLHDAPLLVAHDGGWQFAAASEVLYARGPGMKERSGVADLLPLFVLEAHPAANAPLRELFGVRMLDDVLNWEPAPGESALGEDELTILRARLRELLPALLARIRAERTETRDHHLLSEFLERVEPVEDLELTSSVDGSALRRFTDRRYFVSAPKDGQAVQAFIAWEGPPWPPGPDEQHSMAMAMADLLGINLVEAFLAFLGTDDAGRRRLLDSTGATGHLTDIEESGLETPAEVPTPTPTPPVVGADEDATSEEPAVPKPVGPKPAAPPVPLHDFASLLIDGEPLLITGPPAEEDGDDPDTGSAGPGGNRGKGFGAAPGVDTGALDALGMRIAATFELRRLARSGARAAVLGFGQDVEPDVVALVIDVSTPAAIRRAEDHPVAKQVLLELERDGVSRNYPGFDLLTIADGRPDRLIELKSSTVDARVQAMSWNEWKSARNSRVRERFWLYLVGNLRADLHHATPYVRAIHDPFGTLVGEEVHQEQIRRAVQLRVREFKTAEHLDLSLTEESSASMRKD